jgi:hypothetical protein
MNLFNETHRSFIQLLNEHKVEYCLIGGYAVNLYGYHRTTGDMDILIKPTQENKEKILKAIDAFGYDTSELQKENFEQALYFFLGDFPFKIDILNQTVGINFIEIEHRIVKATYEDLEFNLINKDDLIRNKLSLNTFKDLDDAEKLQKLNNRYSNTME